MQNLGDIPGSGSIGVYQIEINGKRYIGSASKSFLQRWNIHLNDLRRNKHHSRYLQRSYNKYGEDAMVFSILEFVSSPEECTPNEQKYIDLLHPEYNISPVAGSQLGFRHSQESLTKMSAARKGKKTGPLSKEHRAKVSAANKGKVRSEEARARISSAHKGKHLS